METYIKDTDAYTVVIRSSREPTEEEWCQILNSVCERHFGRMIKVWIYCHILHIKDHWGQRYNKSWRPFKFRFCVGNQTYYRSFWIGLKAWWTYRGWK